MPEDSEYDVTKTGAYRNAKILQEAFYRMAIETPEEREARLKEWKRIEGNAIHHGPPYIDTTDTARFGRYYVYPIYGEEKIRLEVSDGGIMGDYMPGLNIQFGESITDKSAFVGIVGFIQAIRLAVEEYNDNQPKARRIDLKLDQPLPKPRTRIEEGV